MGRECKFGEEILSRFGGGGGGKVTFQGFFSILDILGTNLESGVKMGTKIY